VNVADLKLKGTFLTMRTVLRMMSAAGDPGAKLVARSNKDPKPLYDAIRGQGEVILSKLGIYMTASYAAASQVVRDPRFIVQTADSITLDYLDRPGNQHLVRPLQDSLMSMNPPEHTRLRKLASPAFTNKQVRRRSGQIETIVKRYLDRLDADKPFDLITAYASPVPIQVVSSFLGIPEPDDERFHRWGSVLGPALDGVKSLSELEKLRATLQELSDFFDELIPYRRANPADDVISGILINEPKDQPLTRRELTAVTLLLLLAGLETTLNLIGNGVLALLEHPDQRDRLLADPQLDSNLVEEVLRYESPVQFTIRTAAEDIDLMGTTVPKGKQILVLMAGANRDPRTFPEPGRFDITRENSRDHLSFSAGHHYCLGAGLARLTAAAAIRQLFQRFPNLSLAGPVQRSETRVIRGAEHIPLLGGKA
jgi:cytochrome P450